MCGFVSGSKYVSEHATSQVWVRVSSVRACDCVWVCVYVCDCSAVFWSCVVLYSMVRSNLVLSGIVLFNLVLVCS